MAKLQSGTVVYGNLTVNTFANINGNLILGAQIYAAGSPGSNGQVLQNVGGTGVQWANPSSGSSIFNGTSNVTVLTSGSNVVISVAGSIIANIGSSGLTVIGGISAGSITGNGAALTGLPAGYSNVQLASYLAGGISTGAITSTGYFNTTANISASVINNATTWSGATMVNANTQVRALTVGGGELSIVGQSGATPVSFLNIHDYAGNYGNAATFYIRGLVTNGSGSALLNVFNVQAVTSQFAGNVVPTASNTYTLGSTTAWWTTTYSKAMQAQYADLAETYSSDRQYVPGTVVVFGGSKEVTISTQSHDPAIAGVVSTNPAYHMNASAIGIPIALQGRVPTRVKGPVAKGDRLVASDIKGVAIKLDKTLYEPGCIIGKALEDITDDRVHTIEVVVGRV